MDTKQPITPNTNPAPAKEPKYIGPAYTKGLVLPDGLTYRPAHMDTAAIKAFLKKFPARASWWKPAPTP